MEYKYRILNWKEVYHGFFKITRYLVDFQYFSGGWSGALARECLGTGGVVAALPYDPNTDEFVFIEQFRIGLLAAGEKPWSVEIVAGFMDKANESPEQCIQRELQEEIGTPAEELLPVMRYFASPGGSGAVTHLYFARVDVNKIQPLTGLHEEGEDIRVMRVSRQQAQRWLQEGVIRNATLLLALQAFFLRDRVSLFK